MPEEKPNDIVQDGRVYRYACTEDVTVGGKVWTRDRYVNVRNKESYLLVNFIDTGKQAGKAEVIPAPRESKSDIGKFIREWKERSSERR